MTILKPEIAKRESEALVKKLNVFREELYQDGDSAFSVVDACIDMVWEYFAEGKHHD